MYVYGGTPGRGVRTLDWSIERVVDEGTHPWCLDLFDPKPKLIKCDGETLLFQGLANIVFAYDDEDDRVIVGIHDGKRSLCLSGKKATPKPAPKKAMHVFEFEMSGPSDKFELTDLRRLDNQFNVHWKEYLRRIFESDVALPVYRHAKLDSMKLRDGRLLLDLTRYVDARTMWNQLGLEFVGEMRNLTSVPIILPPELAWPYQVLQRWRPIINGSGLAKWLLGQPQARIDVRLLVDEERLKEIKPALESANVEDLKITARRSGGPSLFATTNPWSCRFRVGGVRYSLTQAEEWPGHAPFEPLPNLSISDLTLSFNGRRLVGSRMALFDMARRQCRQLKVNEEQSEPDWRLQKLESRGITVLPDATSPTNVIPGCHVDPLLPAWLEQFRRATCQGHERNGNSMDFPASYMEHIYGRFLSILEECKYSEGKQPEFEFKPVRGLSPQYTNDVLRHLCQAALTDFQNGNRETACVSLRELRNYLIDRLVVDHPENKDAPKWVSWLTGGGQELDRVNRLAGAVQKGYRPSPVVTDEKPDDDRENRSMVVVFRDPILLGARFAEEADQKIVNKVSFTVRQYLRAIENPCNPRRSLGEVDSELIRAVEASPLLREVASSPEEFRLQVLAGATTSGAMRANLLQRKPSDEQLRSLLMRLCMAVYDFVVNGSQSTDSSQAPRDDIYSKMGRLQAFCPHCAREAVEEVLNHPEQAPAEVKAICKRFRFRVNIEKEMRKHQKRMSNDFEAQLSRGKASCVRQFERGKNRSFPKGGTNFARGFNGRSRHA